MALLDDLENWHRDGERPEASFAARLHRLERLHDALTTREDRAAIRQALRAALDDLGSRFEWWSMGMAVLAGFVQQEDAPDALIRAHRIAQEGQLAHPESIGGQRCRHVVAAIEAPHFDVTTMQSDGLERRSILIRHKNLTTLYMRAYRVDLLERVESSRDYNLLPAYREVPQIMRERLPVDEWTVELPATPDYRVHQTYSVPPIQAPGLYVIVASARRSFSETNNRVVAVNLLLSDLVLLSRNSSQGFDIEVRSGSSGLRSRRCGGDAVPLRVSTWTSPRRQPSIRSRRQGPVQGIGSRSGSILRGRSTGG